MKKGFYLLFAMLLVTLSSGELYAQKTFDKSGKIARDFEERRKAVANDSYFKVFDKELTGRQRQAMQFLYAYMPLPDIADYSGDFHLENVNCALAARREMPWGSKVPVREFLHFVLPVRVNNEDLDNSRTVFYNELKERVVGLSMYDAVLEVNHWCHEKVTYTPGEFCNYANKFLRTQGTSNKPDTHWNIKRIEIALAGIADPNKAFTIKLKDKSIASLVELAEDGVLLSINATQEPDNKKDKDTETIHFSKQLNPKELLSEEILSATSTAKMAELVAREIYNIRDSRNSIIRGQADNMPKDGEALKLILKNLMKKI